MLCKKALLSKYVQWKNKIKRLLQHCSLFWMKMSRWDN